MSALATPRRPGRPPKPISEARYTAWVRFVTTPAMKRYIMEQPDGAGAYLRDLVLRDIDAALDVAVEGGADEQTVAGLRALLGLDATGGTDV